MFSALHGSFKERLKKNLNLLIWKVVPASAIPPNPWLTSNILFPFQQQIPDLLVCNPEILDFYILVKLSVILYMIFTPLLLMSTWFFIGL